MKIAKSYIQQSFPDHLAGFYKDLGSIPSTFLSKQAIYPAGVSIIACNN